MIEGKKVLGVIPARGGSKGVPRKNIRRVDGKPLIAYTIETARQSRYLDRIVVSSEDAEIKQIAIKYGVEVLDRPPHLSQDETPGIDPVLHAVETCPGIDYVVLLQPTSPLRTAQDIDGTLTQCVKTDAPFCVSICEAEVSPYRLFQLNAKKRLARFMSGAVVSRRQDLPQFYTLNGAVYAANVPCLQKERRFISDATVGYLMPLERSLDIDTEQDMQFFEYLTTINPL